MKLYYWVAEFTNDRSQVFRDWTRAKTEHNAAKYFEKEYGGIVYWIDGPFLSENAANSYIKSTNKRTEARLTELREELQKLAHKYGYETFIDEVAQACFWASDDTEDFDDKSLTQQYRYIANAIIDARANEPEFSNESYLDDIDIKTNP